MAHFNESWDLPPLVGSCYMYGHGGSHHLRGAVSSNGCKMGEETGFPSAAGCRGGSCYMYGPNAGVSEHDLRATVESYLATHPEDKEAIVGFAHAMGWTSEGG